VQWTVDAFKGFKKDGLIKEAGGYPLGKADC